MDPVHLVFAVLSFLAVALLLEGLYLTWNAYLGPEARRVERRLQAISAGGNVAAPLVRKRLLSDVPAIDRALQRLPRIHALDRFLMQSGISLTVAGFLGICAAGALGGAVAAALGGAPPIVSAAAAVAPVALWAGYIQRRRVKRHHRGGPARRRQRHLGQ